MAMYRCVCGEWVTTLDPHECKLYPFNVIMTDEDKADLNKKISYCKVEEDNEKLKEDMESLLHTLDVVIDELSYGLKLDKHLQNRDFYINNAIRLIQEAKGKIHKFEK